MCFLLFFAFSRPLFRLAFRETDHLWARYGHIYLTDAADFSTPSTIVDAFFVELTAKPGAASRRCATNALR